MEAENKSVEDSFKAKSDVPPPEAVAAAMPAMAEAVRVSMLMEFKRRVFQLSRCSPML